MTLFRASSLSVSLSVSLSHMHTYTHMHYTHISPKDICGHGYYEHFLVACSRHEETEMFGNDWAVLKQWFYTARSFIKGHKIIHSSVDPATI